MASAWSWGVLPSVGADGAEVENSAQLEDLEVLATNTVAQLAVAQLQDDLKNFDKCHILASPTGGVFHPCMTVCGTMVPTSITKSTAPPSTGFLSRPVSLSLGSPVTSAIDSSPASGAHNGNRGRSFARRNLLSRISDHFEEDLKYEFSDNDSESSEILLLSLILTL